MSRFFLILFGLVFAGSPLCSADDIVKLAISEVAVNKTELLHLANLKIGDAIDLVKKKNVRVIVLDKLVNPRGERNPELEFDSGNEAQYFLAGTFDSGFGKVAATYIAAEEDGLFRKSAGRDQDRGPRPFRSEPLIVLTAECKVTDLVHEYLHHLIQTETQSFRIIQDKKVPFREVSRLLQNEAINIVESAAEKQIKASKELDNAAYAAAENEMVMAVGQSLTAKILSNTLSMIEEMDITRFFVENADDFRLDKSAVRFNLAYHSAAFATGLRKVEADMKSYQKMVDDPVRKKLLSQETAAHIKRDFETLNSNYAKMTRYVEWFNQFLKSHPEFIRETAK